MAPYSIGIPSGHVGTNNATYRPHQWLPTAFGYPSGHVWSHQYTIRPTSGSLRHWDTLGPRGYKQHNIPTPPVAPCSIGVPSVHMGTNSTTALPTSGSLQHWHAANDHLNGRTAVNAGHLLRLSATTLGSRIRVGPLSILYTR